MKRTASSWLTLIVAVSWLIATVSGSVVMANASVPQRATSPAGTLKLAILAPLTGPVSSLGRSARDGALLAIAQRNAGGGILGMTIDPVVEDTACDASMAVAATHKVIDQAGARYIIGDICSGASTAMSEITNAASVIQISPTSTNPQVTVDAGGEVKPYVFRACFIDSFQGAAAARFARNTLAARKAFILRNQSDAYYSQGLAAAFEAEFSRLGTIVGKETYTRYDTDFSPILSKIADARPDIVYLPDFYNIVNLITKQAKEKGISASFVGGDGWESPDLDIQAASGGYYTTHFSLEDPRPEVSAFDRAFSSQYGYAPDSVAALAYDAAKLLLQAIGEAGTTDTMMVKTKLAGISYHGVTGPLYYDGNHNPIKSAVAMRVEANGAHFYALIPPQALASNYGSGRPGSYFTLTGAGFPPTGSATITINGHALSETLTVDATGGFAFRLDTTGADAGRYFVTVSVNPNATALFTLDAAAPLRPAEGSAPVIGVPEGIGYDASVHLPIAWR